LACAIADHACQHTHGDAESAYTRRPVQQRDIDVDGVTLNVHAHQRALHARTHAINKRYSDAQRVQQESTAQ
jgi:hypothetical protein